MFTISRRGPILHNNCFSKNKKEIKFFLLFKQRAKEKMYLYIYIIYISV